MFGATTLSGSITSSSQYRACSFHLWVRNIILGRLSIGRTLRQMNCLLA
jgi:hypothetical protein